MRAKLVTETINFERGLDPKEAMGTGIREIKLNDYFMSILKEYKEEYGDEISKKGITKYWKKFKNIIEPLLIGRTVEGYTWKINRSNPFAGNKQFTINKILNTEVIHLFRRDRDKPRTHYINIVDNIGDRYILYFYITYKFKNKSIKESIAFKRGLDPKEAMNVGKHKWHNGWRLVQDKVRELTQYEKNSLFDKINWSRKPNEPDDIYTNIEVTEELEKMLENLAIVNFKEYYNHGKTVGLFGDWPDDFPFNKQLFITHVQEDEDITYLVNPEGYLYPKYITELK